VRTSVYFQGIFSAILLCFPHATDIIKASFRNAVLTLYAIGIALPVTPDRHSSVEVRVVLQGFITILFLTALTLMSCRPVLRTWRHIPALVGTAPLIYWSCHFTIGGIGNPQCGEFEGWQKWPVGSNAYPVYVVLWGISVGFGTLALPVIFLLWVPHGPFKRRVRGVALSVAVITWLISWIMVIIASEVSISGYRYRYRLGFGQIMALVMLFSQIWDIIYYIFSKSEHGGSKVMYWWSATVKPRWSRFMRRFRHRTTMSLEC